MIIGHELMVQLFLMDYFNLQVLQWDGAGVSMKYPICLLGQKYLTGHEICEVVIHTEEQFSTIRSTEIMVNVLDSTYENIYLEQLSDNSTHINDDWETQLLGLIK